MSEKIEILIKLRYNYFLEDFFYNIFWIIFWIIFIKLIFIYFLKNLINLIFKRFYAMISFLYVINFILYC